MVTEAHIYSDPAKGIIRHVNASSALGKPKGTEQMGLGRHRQQDKDKDLAETSTPKRSRGKLSLLWTELMKK